MRYVKTPEESNKAGYRAVRLWILGLPNLEKKSLRGNLTAFSSFLRRTNRERGAILLSLVNNDRMCRNGKELCCERLRLGMRKNFFLAKCWNRFPSKVVDAPCLSMFKRHLDNALNNRI